MNFYGDHVHNHLSFNEINGTRSTWMCWLEGKILVVGT